MAEWFGEAPANAKSCARDRGQEPLRDLPRRRRGRTSTKVAYWTTPTQGLRRRPRSGLQGLLRVGPGLDGDQGLSRRLSACWRRPRLQLSLLLAGPVGWLVIAYLGLAGRPVRGRVLAARHVLRRRSSTSYGLRQLPDARRERRLPHDRRCARSVIAAAVTVTDALLAFPIAFYMAKVARAARARAAGGRGADAAVVELPGEGLRVADDPGRGRDPQLGARPVRAAAGPGFGNVATWLVFSYLWLPYMILPIYAGLERIPNSLLDASGDLGARRRADVPARRAAARAARRSSPARSSRSR